jgi:hypothetical protein
MILISLLTGIFRNNLGKLVLLLSLFGSLPLCAVGVSTIRIYLDNNQSEQSFFIYNKVPQQQTCDLLIRHYEVAAEGGLKPYPDEFVPNNSAVDWFRFSPKRFVLNASGSQAVRFRMRRKPNAEAAEFRSFLAADCVTDVTESGLNKNIQYGLTPRLRHNIPLIVRTGALEATVEFTDISVAVEQVKFAVLRQGTRSVYGHLALIDTRTNEIVDENRHFVVYLETPKKSVTFATQGVSLEHLSIRFVENKKEGGSIDYIQGVQ